MFLRLLAGRFFQLILVLLGITTLLFGLQRVSGDPVLAMLGPDGVTNAEQVAQMRSRYGLDEPLLTQFGIYMGKAVRGDFGDSFIQRRPAMRIVMERVPATVKLAVAALALAILLGLGLGIMAAVSRSRAVSFLLGALAVVGQSVPIFFLGIVALLVFAAQLKILPAFGGAGDVKAMILPAVVLSLLPMARIARLSRAGMSEALRQDYVLTGLSKGLSRTRIVLRDCLPNVLIPIVTLAGYDLVQLFGTQVVAEVVFTWPGLGSQLVVSASQRDYNVVQAIAFVTATAAVLITLTVDMTYRLLDPRIKEASLA